MGKEEKIELGGNREAFILERARVLKALEGAEKAVFFGFNYPGSHEYTQEESQAAQANEESKKALREILGKINKELGLEENSREQLQ